MKFFLTFLFTLILLCTSFEVHSQVDDNNFKKVIIEIDGEEVYDVHSIAQDHLGYMWMGTNLGLIRYDGLEGKKYNVERDNSSSLTSDHIRVLHVDYYGDLWIGVNSGLIKYDSDCDCLIQYPTAIDDIDLTGILSITEDKNKHIWIGTQGGGLFQYEKEGDSFTRFLNKPSDSVNVVNDRIEELLVDKKNNLWIGTYSNDTINGSGLLRYNIKTGKIKQFLNDPKNPNSLIDNRISALYEDNQGNILIGTLKSGFHIYDSENNTLSRNNFDANHPGQLHAPYSENKVFGIPPYVRIIHQDQNGGHWINTVGKGINYFSASTNAFKHYDFNLANPQVLTSFYEDRQGNIWIGGVMGSGLFKTDLFARKYHLNTSFTNVEAAYESDLNPGILWIESQETALSKMNLKTNETRNYRHNQDNTTSIGHNWVRTTYQENKSTLWLGLGNGGPYSQQGNGGIDRMDIETGTFTHFKLTRNDDGLDDYSYTPHTICEDQEGYLWLGAGPGGIFRSDKEKKEFKHFKVLENDNESGNVFLNAARVDSNGDIWASDFAGEGTLYLYDRQQDKFSPYLKGFKMVNLLIDDKGWVLISTWKKGLIHLNPVDKTYIQYTKKDGLPSNESLDITKGDNGIYWVNTRIGPAKFDLDAGEITSVGLPKVRYNTGIFKASDGQIYLGAGRGLYSFYPSQVEGNPYPPQVIISDLLISENNFLTNKNEPDDLTLPYNQNDISFKYVGLHFSNPKKNVYQYKLDPLDDEWINAGNERSVRFANLSPGNYDFQVKASNSDGVWSDKIESIQFIIKPAWWATWWAYALYVTAFAFIIYSMYRFQLSKKLAISESSRLREVNEFKNTLFTNITHEFRTPLTVIKGMTDTIKLNLKTKKLNDVENSLEMIERNSDSLLHLINEMLDLSKIESGNMQLQLVQSDVIPFLKYISESFSSFAEENKISLTIYSEVESLQMDFDGNKLTSVISNLLSNAIKFTPEYGKIIVHINEITQKEKSYLFIKIKDNGIGISSENLPHIFNRFYQTDTSAIRKHEGTGIGLALTKELIVLMNGTIEANSTISKGSEFKIMIPITREALGTTKVNPEVITTFPAINTPSEQATLTRESNSELPLVLIIEDNMDVAHYLKTCLNNTYDTMHAVNGNEGIEMALEKIPDIIICDVMMPGKDGFEVCATLKNDGRSDHIPIIILTAKVTTEDRLTGLSHGADAYLAKPFNKEELFTRLNQLVSLRKKLIDKIQNDGFNTILKKRTEDPKLQFLQKIVKLIHTEISNSNFGSAELAKKLLISESQLYRKIKAITEKSTAVFIRSIRLQFAKELLKRTDKTVSEIAYEVGFNDPSWFSRAFKDEFGVSPSAASK